MIAGELLALAALAAGQGLAACPKEVIEGPREFSGLFVDAFEGQMFYEGVANLDEIRGKHGTGAWMSFDLVGVGAPFGIKRRGPFGAYRMRFIGLRRSRPASTIPCGYGHMNSSASEITLTRLLAIEPVEDAMPTR